MARQPRWCGRNPKFRHSIGPSVISFWYQEEHHHLWSILQEGAREELVSWNLAQPICDECPKIWRDVVVCKLLDAKIGNFGPFSIWNWPQPFAIRRIILTRFIFMFTLRKDTLTMQIIFLVIFFFTGLFGQVNFSCGQVEISVQLVRGQVGKIQNSTPMTTL